MDLTQLSDDDLNLASQIGGWDSAKGGAGNVTQDQLDNAKAVRAASIAKGLNPDFVLPHVMQESGFDQNAVSTDPKTGNPIAHGVMQITPATAKTYGCDDITDRDKNIDCGLNVLKDLSTKFKGDPTSTLAAYNAGPNSKYLKTGDLKDLPDETLNHIDRVSTLYGGDLPSAILKSNDQEKPPTQQTEATAPGTVNFSKSVQSNPDADKAGHIGAGIVGAGVGTGLEAAADTTHFLGGIKDRLFSKPAEPLNQSVQNQSSQQDLEDNFDNAVDKEVKRLTPPPADNSGRAREQTTNGETKRIWAETKQNLQQPGAENALIKAGPMQYRNGVLTPQNVANDLDTTSADAIRQQAIKNVSEKQAAAETASQSAAQNAQEAESAAKWQPVKTAANTALRVAGRVAGGYQAGSQGYDAAKSYQRDNGWSWPTVTHGLSAIGGLASMSGTLPGVVAGTALSVPDQLREANDAYKKIKATNAANPMKDENGNIQYAPQLRPHFQ